ncbi:MAG: hypothetical protein IH984_14760 [Planctomycetes bacterium]|nr:hypothetical protein [Planctomycetota bacterium]
MKRRLFKLALFLLLGAVVNVAVAWLIAVRVNVVGSGPDLIEITYENSQPTGVWLLSRWTQMGVTCYTSYHEYYGYAVAYDPESDSNPIDAIHITTPSPSEVTPKWTGLRTPVSRGIDEFREVRGWGWPCSSMWSEYFLDFSVPAKSGWNFTSGIDPRGLGLSSTRQYNDPFPRILPVRPIWPGFAINTVFYAAILWLLTLAPFTARRMIRRKRGCCLKCGYDLRNVEHEKCSECGKELCARAKE